MKIAQIEIYQHDLAVKGGVYRLSGGREYTSYDATFARVIGDDGQDGWGEATPFGATYIAARGQGTRAALDLLRPALTSRDPRACDQRSDIMAAPLKGHRDARCALDVACWDLSARAAGLPLCDVIGGRIDGQVPVISSISSDSPEVMRAMVAAQIAIRDAPVREVSVPPPHTPGPGVIHDLAKLSAPVAEFGA